MKDINQEALDKAFEALKTFDWGTGITIPDKKPPEDKAVLSPIEDAVTAVHGNAAAGKALEARLAAILKTDAPRAAKDFACRKLAMLGSAESVPALAALLPDENLSHMARFALESNSAPEAATALREALPRLSGGLKIGVIGSLGKRRDAASAPALALLLADGDEAIARAAASALGMIGTPEAAAALRNRLATAPERGGEAVIDACLNCAERLLAGGKKAQAIALYNALKSESHPKHVRLAATRGLLSALGKKDD